jgi:hypothetical protein
MCPHPRLAVQPSAQISLNHLGRRGIAAPDLFVANQEEGGVPTRFDTLRATRRHLIDVQTELVGDTLRVRWIYSSNLHRRDSIRAVAELFIASLCALIDRAHTHDSTQK